MPCARRSERQVIPATAAAVRDLLQRLERTEAMAALSTEERECTLLVLAEAMNNVVKHGYGGGSGWIAVVPGRTGRDWRIMDGATVPLPEACRRSVLPRPDMDGGFGWPLILALTERVAAQRKAGFNVLSLEVRGQQGLRVVDMPLAKIA